MSHWNHRVVKEITQDGNEWFTVREVFYNDDGSIYAYTEDPVKIAGESIEDLRKYCQWVLNCLDKEVLIDGEVEFVDFYRDMEDEENATDWLEETIN